MKEPLEERFRRHVDEAGLLAGARTLLVAHSGGGDSTALLLLVSEWARPRPSNHVRRARRRSRRRAAGPTRRPGGEAPSSHPRPNAPREACGRPPGGPPRRRDGEIAPRAAPSSCAIIRPRPGARARLFGAA